MLDISDEQSALQIKFLKALDLFCIFKFIITNDVKIHERQTYDLLISILNSYSLINIKNPSGEIFSETEKIYKKYFWSNGEEEKSTSASVRCEGKVVPDSEQAQRNGPTVLKSKTYNGLSNVQKGMNKSREIFTNDSLFSKHLNNKQIFQFFKFPKSKKVGDYVNKCCVDELINEPLNINVGFVKFDKKKRRKKKRKRPEKGTVSIPTNLCKYNSDSGIHNSRLKNSCSCFYQSKENSKIFKNNFKKMANEADLSVSDSSELFSSLRTKFVKDSASRYFALDNPNGSNSEDESDYNYYSENTNRDDPGNATHNNRNVKLRNQFLSVKLSMYNSRLCNSGGKAHPAGAEDLGVSNTNKTVKMMSPANHPKYDSHANSSNHAIAANHAIATNHFYDETSMCFNHFYEIHNILNRDPNGLRKIKIMIKKDIGTISISPFYVNFDWTRIFKRVCTAFNITNFNYKNQGIYQIINSCFSTPESREILKHIFLDDLYEQQEIFDSEMNGKKNAKKKNFLKMKNKEHVLEILDDEKRINVLYFINRFLYSQKTPLSNLFTSYCLQKGTNSEENATWKRLKLSKESAQPLLSQQQEQQEQQTKSPPPVQVCHSCTPDDDPPFDELTIDYLLFLMLFEKKIDEKFHKYLLGKIESCKDYLADEGQEKNASTESSLDSQQNWNTSHHQVRKIDCSSFHVHREVEKQVKDTDPSDATQSHLDEFKQSEISFGKFGVSPIDHDGNLRGGDKMEVSLPSGGRYPSSTVNGELTSMGSFASLASLTSFTSFGTQMTITTHDSISTQSAIPTNATICRKVTLASDNTNSTCNTSSTTPGGISLINLQSTNEVCDETVTNPPAKVAYIQSESDECQNKIQLVKKTNKQNEERTNEQPNERTNEQSNEQPNEQSNEQPNEQTNEQTNEQMNESMKGTTEDGHKEMQKGLENDEHNYYQLKKTELASDIESNNKSRAKYASEIQNEITLLKCIRPFPTVYWLINKNMCGYISHLEKMNIIKNIEFFVNCKKEEFRLLRYYLIYDHLKYIIIRLRHVHKRILRFFYNLFLNSFNFKKQFTQHENNHCCISSIYTNSFDFSPHVLSKFIHTYQIDSQVINEIFRKINTLRVKGIGGISNFLTVKCIHLYFASHLSYPNTIGYILEEIFKS
ncbi:rhoptry protein, putative [Plasmodium knowlesi strain H]|uniref:Rhoptry protein, putative n=3 Tax=Plasmodium knowlesi TaxID=5850 RepID=A0A5K1U334_PLAKH|nr:rhoptry protein RHOP148, putative [Plasmodium knowlesi strain H]OTN64687.1 putative Rhoptry protein [Plasmodium knowlesi]CAA9988878.1 rhoptry protein RHOP148, putative [Plasmodium knowlesi strain H]SBO24715.1 rhoptry protein, putative [Plasmodium knowlesi strain H]SBO27987.1 rhoptry protein, putative [Plasmodium knowlesi strain H]VVS78352.1 rhoptry protein RHOP148, putative [Plasmodium knowlesi strain H]|eukprot:XP_002261224.1 Rhoptry protein, putative [Plasmodium knowlesi strain H]